MKTKDNEFMFLFTPEYMMASYEFKFKNCISSCASKKQLIAWKEKHKDLRVTRVSWGSAPHVPRIEKLEEILAERKDFLLCYRKHKYTHEYILFESGHRIKELTFCERENRRDAIRDLIYNLYTDNCSRYKADDDLKKYIKHKVRCNTMWGAKTVESEE